MTDIAAQIPLVRSDEKTPEIPAYLRETCAWAYLKPVGPLVFDHSIVVSAIPWGNSERLKRAAFAEIRPGQSVLQPACVYGRLSLDLATSVSPRGRLDVTDIAPIPVANCRRKLREFPRARARVADATAHGGGSYDVVCCFFRLHELPDDHKRRVVDGLLNSVAPRGRVAFVDYHVPSLFHPLKGSTSILFDCLEPFATTLRHREVSSFTTMAERFAWRKETCFGGLFQKAVAERSTSAAQTWRVT